jgi:hypothetical protein
MESCSQADYPPHMATLRLRYYAHLSWFDKMAKAYGEMHFLIKVLLFSVSMSICILGVLQMFLLFLGLTFLLMIDFLSTHYDGMEERFKVLVSEMGEMSRQLEFEKQSNQQLKEQVKNDIELLEKLKIELEDKKNQISKAHLVIENALQKINLATDVFVEKAISLNEAFEFPEKKFSDLGFSKEDLEDTEHLIDSICQQNQEAIDLIKQIYGVDLFHQSQHHFFQESKHDIPFNNKL